jgi:hypothetical protein
MRGFAVYFTTQSRACAEYMKNTQFYSDNQKKDGDHSWDLDIDGKIMLKSILKK